MTYLLKLVLATTLGVAAAATNWLYMTAQSTPASYVAIGTNLKPGQEIRENDLVAVPVPGDAQELRKSLVPYASRSVLFGRKASRLYLDGDLVFSRDLVIDPALSQWDVIGPFELISVGERFTEAAGRESSLSGSTRGDTVTIAVNAEFDLQTSRLLSVIAADVTSANAKQSRAEGGVEIVAVQVIPSQQRRGGDASLAEQNPRVFADASSFTAAVPQGKVFQTVSLRGITSVPSVLLEGDFIRFVVPSMAY